MNEHVAVEALAAYVDGTLDAGLRPGVEAHLSRCRECREELAEVLEAGQSREKAPAEFVSRALGDHAGAGMEHLPRGRAAMPARLVFGVAAVFLVAALLGYFFLDRGGLGPAPAVEKSAPPAAAAKDDRPPARVAGTGETSEETRQRPLPAREALSEETGGLRMEKKSVPAPASAVPAKAEAPAPLAAQTRPEPAAEEESLAARDMEGGIVGGVVGGIEAPMEKDKEYAAKTDAALETRSKGAWATGEAQRSRLPGPGASSDAMQLFLAMTGRAAAPRVLPAAAPPPLRVGGDVTLADLLDAGSLDGWEWFPEGRSLDLTIDAAGIVEIVRLPGDWTGREAERARVAAGKLAFRPSARRTRRAVIFR